MPYVFFGGEQAFKTSLRFLIVAVHIHQNLRRTTIVGNMHSGHAHKTDARIRQFSFHQRFDFLAQGLA